ncbi:MAG: ImmA/IrrE family metallo-endopeptidase [Candidatus Cybelea sp.]
MRKYVNIERELDAMLRYTGVPRLENAIGVDVEVLVRTKLDFDVAYIENLCIRGKQLSGALIPEHRVILVEAFDIWERRRFTLAHECAHLVLDFRNAGSPSLFESHGDSFICAPDDIGTTEDSPWQKRREVLANQFAAALLMPGRLCKQLYVENNSIDDCAGALGVSRQALQIRLNQLGLRA